MPDFNVLDDVLDLQKKAQNADQDQRNQAREVSVFLTKRDGQWEQSVWDATDGRPRYTFDLCNPIVDSIHSQIERSDFDIRVSPSGGESSKDTAEVFDGLIRNIETISNANHIYNAAAHKMISQGIGGWRVVSDWVSADAFEQDLKIVPIADFEDRVWFGPHVMPDASDATYCFVLEAIPLDEFKKRYPDKDHTSLSQDFCEEQYWPKNEVVIIGEFIYKKPVTIELAQMSNGKVYKIDDDYKKVKNDLAKQGITEKTTRKRKSHEVKSRIYSQGGWLSDEQDTPFKSLPVIPIFGNFKIIQNKPVYWGVVDKLLDAQRVYNYAESRKIEEGALAPRKKLMMTAEQAAGHTAKLGTMNTNADPVQLYTHVDGQIQPYETSGPQVNQSLFETSASAKENINAVSGQFAANLGQNPNVQSGAAIGLQVEQGDASNLKYISSLEVGICQTAKVLIEAIPVVYDTMRQVRLLGEDGAMVMATLHDMVHDDESGEMVEINDLSKGVYDVTCRAMPGYKSRQEHSAKAMMDIFAINPQLMEMGGDILLQNINAPGVETLAARVRQNLLQQGVIPRDQMKEEEIEQAQAAAQQPKEPSFEDKMGDAQLQTAQAELQKVQVQTANLQQDGQIAAVKLQQAQQTIDMKEDDQAFNQQMEINKTLSERVQAQQDAMNTMADTLNKLVDATGAQGIIGPHTTEAVINQAISVTQAQETMNPQIAQEQPAFLTDQPI